MSDDVFAVRTTYQDVAELGQGYLERADGERLLLPLPSELNGGEGVRFIVYLADGTPAFAGAGRAVQVSDQGTEVASEERFETLIDGLVFDERSRPVYEYIVAVRQMAYADLGAAAEAEAAVGEEAVLEQEEPTTHNEPASEVLLDAMRTPVPTGTASDKPSDTVTMDPVGPALELDEEPLPPALEAAPEEEFATATPQDHNAGLAFAVSNKETVEAPAIEEIEAAAEAVPTPSNLPLPTGILRRPAIAAGWQPIAAKRPQPTKGSGLFRYAPGSLPVPKKPPRPELRPEQRLQPAAGPGR